MEERHRKRSRNQAGTQLPLWTVINLNVFLAVSTLAAALLSDAPLSSLSRSNEAVFRRQFFCQERRYYSTKTQTRRFGTVAPDSLFRSTIPNGDSTKRGHHIDSSSSNNHLARDESRSSFWSTSVKLREDGDVDSSGKRILLLPNVPTLDFDGPLPRGAYRTLGNPQFEPKPTCLLTVAVDVQPRDDKDSDDMDPHVIVKRMQRLIDSGLTTFSLRLPDAITTSTTNSHNNYAWCQDWAEENVYGRLLRDTPATVLAQTQLIVPMTLPTGEPGKMRKDDQGRDDDDDEHVPVTANSIRKTVLGSLQRMGADCIDTLQLQYVDSSPYHMEVLDYLTDLQREGLIRSITGRNLPPEFLEQAHRRGFHLDNNQIDGGSLLMPLECYDSDSYNKENRNSNNNNIASSRRRQRMQKRPSLQETMSKTGTRLLLASPLAGGLLTERHLGKRMEPKPWEFASESERQQYISTLVPRWFRQRTTTTTSSRQGPRKNDNSRWLTYQRQLLDPLQDIAWKHCVSIAAVSLRYVLQNQQHDQLQQLQRNDPDPFSLASVVVSSRLGARCENYDNRWDRPQQLRQVFQFSLDEEDMERLNEIAYRNDNDNGFDDHQMEEKKLFDSWEQEYDDRHMDRFEQEQLLLNNLPDISNRRLWL